MFFIANIIDGVASVCHMLVSAYIFVVLAACVMTWFRVDPYNAVVRVIHQLTEPAFYFVRKHLPFTYGRGIDFSPFVVIIALELFDRIVIRSVAQFAATL